MRNGVRLTALLLTIAAGHQNGVAAKAQLPIEPTQLDVAAETPFDLRGFQLLREGMRCDAEGNVFFMPYKTTEVVRVPASGGPAHTIDLSAELGRPTQRGLGVHGMAVDDLGRLHVVLFERRDGAHYIAIFDRDGALVDKVPLDFQQIVARQLAVFGTGAYFLVGSTPWSTWPQPLIADANGRPSRRKVEDAVKAPTLAAFDAAEDQGRSAPHDLNLHKTFVTSTADGHVLFAREDGPVYGVSATGDVDRRIDLARPPSGTLVELKTSGSRLAAVYDVRGDTPSRWVDVYDIESGVQRARYGPVRQAVMCYYAQGALDRFDLLGSRNGQYFMVHATIPGHR